MASLPPEVQQIINAAEDLTITKYLALVSTTALVYDLIITFPLEVAHIWGAPWTIGKFLYYANRYPYLLETSAWLAYSLSLGGVDDQFCIGMVYVNSWSAWVLLLPMQAIFILRTIAIWGRSRIVIALLVMTALATAIVTVFSIAKLTRRIKFASNPVLKPVLGCYSVSANVDLDVAIPAWAILLVFDTVIFSLTFIIAVRRYRTVHTRLFTVLFRDGLLYYFLMLFTSTSNLIVFTTLASSRPVLAGAVIPAITSSMCIFGNRIVLNLRSVFRDDTFLLSIHPVEFRDPQQTMTEFIVNEESAPSSQGIAMTPLDSDQRELEGKIGDG